MVITSESSMIAENGWGLKSQRLDSHCSYSKHSCLHAMVILPHAMENKFRREYLWLIITCGQMAQYSQLNTNEFKVTNGKSKNGWRGVKKKKITTNFSPEWTGENYLDCFTNYICINFNQTNKCCFVSLLFLRILLFLFFLLYFVVASWWPFLVYFF